MKEIIDVLENLAKKTINDCTFSKKVNYFNSETEEDILLPSGDEKYFSFWVRDCSLMAESNLIPDNLLKKYIEIIAENGQNRNETIFLKNGLYVPPYTIADHINYDGKPVYFPGTYDSGEDQGNGDFGFSPPHCDNYYYIMIGTYISQSGNWEIINEKHGALTIEESLERAFEGHNIDSESELCVSDSEKHTVDWGFTDAVKKSGKLLMPSLLRYNAAKTLQKLFYNKTEKSEFYRLKAEKIKESIVSVFYDNKTGWFYSATGKGKQYDVWGTAFAVYSDVAHSKKTLQALYDAYKDSTAVVDGYVRQILTTNDYSTDSAWESSLFPYNEYQNGGYWATPTGWYAYALYKYNNKTEILEDFIRHTEKYESDGAPFEWINKDTTECSGKNYGTSGVLPYVGLLKINEKLK